MRKAAHKAGNCTRSWVKRTCRALLSPRDQSMADDQVKVECPLIAGNRAFRGPCRSACAAWSCPESSPAPRAAYLESSAISKDNTKCSEDVLVIVTSILR